VGPFKLNQLCLASILPKYPKTFQNLPKKFTQICNIQYLQSLETVLSAKDAKPQCLSFHYLQISQLSQTILPSKCLSVNYLKSYFNMWNSDVSKQVFCKQPDFLCRTNYLRVKCCCSQSMIVVIGMDTNICTWTAKEQKHAHQYWTKYVRRMLLHTRERCTFL